MKLPLWKAIDLFTRAGFSVKRNNKTPNKENIKQYPAATLASFVSATTFDKSHHESIEFTYRDENITFILNFWISYIGDLIFNCKSTDVNHDKEVICIPHCDINTLYHYDFDALAEMLEKLEKDYLNRQEKQTKGA